ncbi:MAG: bifunctional phosphopantothenoylcysteine decarboxylase/phosphopantothenate--cysteine ligase CoaBC [Lachnospiraceae bacterium]|nr:bifunctional phosphopantothenoylcysteine decarboxylase/phosphopantothenate--cysteine ligase CoaBC [Lachnospiraceae bacterium]
MLKDKKIVLGVTGSIAAYKAADLCSMLKKDGADVTVIMTKNALNFINPITFETLTGNKCLVDTFDRNFEYKVEHVELAKSSDLLMVAPATANIIAKTAMGIADDMLSTTILACSCSKLFAPAMNTRMYENPATLANIELLKKRGMKIIDADTGYLACGDVGKGKLAAVADLREALIYELCLKDMEGLKVVVTAGPTREELDPVRFISNHSTGKMGYAIAAMAARRGAEVTLVSGASELETPYRVRRVDIVSAADMAAEVKSLWNTADIIVKAAAVADYTPLNYQSEKMKKKDSDLNIPLKRTEDILGWLGENKRKGQVICGFSMETENMLENSRKKLQKKNADILAANNLKVEGAGFGTDTNVVTLITADEVRELPKMSKEDVACELLDEILKIREKRRG